MRLSMGQASGASAAFSVFANTRRAGIAARPVVAMPLYGGVSSP